ncbi:MAG: Ig-like domain-containing protein, partial [Chloroflexota bacterium]
MKTLVRSVLWIVLLTAVACQQPREVAVQPTSIPAAGSVSSEAPTAQPTPTISPAEPEATAVLELVESDDTNTPPAGTEQPQAVLAPQFDADSYPVTEPIIFSFNQPMEPNSVEQPISMTPYKEGEFVWSENNTQLAFYPNTPLEPLKFYIADVHPRLESIDGERLTGITKWTLTIEDSPRVMAYSPATQNIASLKPSIRVSFSHEMDQASVAEAISIRPEQPFMTEWDNNELKIILEDYLEFNTNYFVTITDTAVAQDGRAIYQPFTFRLHLAPPLQRAQWRQEADKEPTLTLSWNYPIDTSVSNEPFTITPPLAGRWEWHENRKRATFYPASQVPPSTDYSVQVSSLTAVGNHPLPSVRKIFFTTNSVILSAIPTNIIRAQNQTIEVTFDRPMDKASVEGAFTIEPPIDGTVSWNENTFIFVPEDGFFDALTRYTYYFDTTAVSESGLEVFDDLQTFTFETTTINAVADFGSGPNAQVVDINGRRAVQYRSKFANSILLNFNLYAFEPDEYADLFANQSETNWREYDGELILTDTGTPDYRWQSRTTNAFSEWNHIQETIIPNDIPAGLYVLEIATDHAKAQLFLNLSQNTIVAKTTDQHLTTWVSEGGKTAVSDATIILIDQDGSPIAEGQTSSTGVAKFDLRTLDGVPYFVMAIQGDDATITGLNSSWRQGFRWWERPAEDTLNYAVYGYTDRPIYKPGQTVFFKGIVRQDEDAILSNPPEGTAVTVRIVDARDNVVRTFEHTVNDFGTLDGSFDLADGAMLGTYSLDFVINGEVHSQLFKVEQYRKPDYEITVAADKESYFNGEDLTLTIDASYFIGEPVPNATVMIKQYRLEQVYSWYGYDEDYIWVDNNRGVEINTQLDENGTLIETLSANTHFNDEHYFGSNLRSHKIGYEVTVNDGSNQTVSSFVVVDIYNQEAGIEIDRDNYVHTEGSPINITTRVAQIDGTPIANQPVQLVMRRYNRTTNHYDTVADSYETTSDANGYATFTITDADPGYVRLEAISSDLRGKRLSFISGIYVYSNTQTTWFRILDNIEITADKETYQPGETAVLYIESLIDGPALLTVERGTVRREIEVLLTPPFTQFELPIIETDAPNIHVTINAFRPQTVTELSDEIYASLPDADLVQGSINLSVPPTHKQLSVTIIPAKESYAPGEEAEFIVRVTNSEGVPVSAELSVALVDDAIFALSDELSGPIFDGFYFERDNLIRDYHSYGPIRYLGGGGGGGGGGGLGPSNPRSDFQDTAVWLPNLRTDFNGEVRIT